MHCRVHTGLTSRIKLDANRSLRNETPAHEAVRRRPAGSEVDAVIDVFKKLNDMIGRSLEFDGKHSPLGKNLAMFGRPKNRDKRRGDLKVTRMKSRKKQ